MADSHFKVWTMENVLDKKFIIHGRNIGNCKHILHLMYVDVVRQKKVDQTNGCVMRHLIQTVLCPFKIMCFKDKSSKNERL